MDRSDFMIFKSVIGFKDKDVATEIVESDGTVRFYKGGIKSTCIPPKIEYIVSKECDPKWFTNFNQALLDKLKDYHKNNM